MPVFVQVTTNQFRDVIGRFARATNESAVAHSEQHVTRAAELLGQALQQEAPVGKLDPLGRPRRWPPLAKNINYRLRKSGRGWKVSFTAPPQVRFVLRGTTPHDIFPRGKWPLHFYWDRVGAEVWFWRVRHPGTEANRFDQRAAEKVKAQIGQELARGVRDWLVKLMAK